jgi:hypothetical protein
MILNCNPLRYYTSFFLFRRRRIVFLDLPDDQLECLDDVFIMTSRSFGPRANPFLRQRLALLWSYLPTWSGEPTWKYLCICKSDLFPTRHMGTQSVPFGSVRHASTNRMIEDFITYDFNHLQRRPGSYGIHKQVSVNPNRMS